MKDNAEIGPVAIGALVVLALVVMPIMGFALGWWGEASQVAREEFGPRELLRKYEWFKDAAAQLDAKRAGIEVYDAQMRSMEEDYEGQARQNWTRDDRETYNQWKAESTGLKLSYNNLAAEYNAQMAKFNWRFTNRGTMPECVAEYGDACQELPREFRAYVVS